jgi:hypothetical protein
MLRIKRDKFSREHWVREKSSSFYQKNKEDVMKQIFGIIIAVFIMVVASAAIAAPMFVDAIPTCDANGNVTIPPLPAGTTLLNVVIFDAPKGIPGKSLGAVSSFNLKPGEGFNFTWKDSEGTWWQMVTPETQAIGLVTDCSHPEGCKFLYE